MNIIQTFVNSLVLTGKRNPNGWTSFNCPACIHRGQSRPDTKQRGGLFLEATGGFKIHCFNCKFNTGWFPGVLLNKQVKKFFTWTGCSDEQIQLLNFEAFKLKQEIPESDQQTLISKKLLKVTSLPEGSRLLEDWAAEASPPARFIKSVEYLNSRHEHLYEWYPKFYWSPEHPDRVILPIEFRGQLYGWTARLTRPERNKDELRYLMGEGEKFLFGADSLYSENRKYVILVEGPMDACSIGGVALLGSEITANQLAWINSSDKEIILVPDKDKAGNALIDVALENDWSVSFPPFEKGVKDVFDAVRRYGRLATVQMILGNKEANPTKIQINRKLLNVR